MDQGNTAFLLIMAALVLLMTPGLAFFYGGLVKAKSVISMMMMSFGAIGLIGVIWVLYGYSIAFPSADGLASPWSIDWSAIGLTSLLETPEGAAYPPLAFVAFIDRVYDAEVPIVASGIPLDQVFDGEMMAGGYRKKYLRAMSRMIALTTGELPPHD